MLLFEFDIVFVVRKAIKGHAIVDYLVDQPLNNLAFSESLFLDEDVLAIEPDPSNVELWRWKLYFDGAANTTGQGMGSILVSPKGQQILVSVKLNFDCMNNVIEYEACIVGLQVALEFNAYDLSVFGDSLLIMSQIEGKCKPETPIGSILEMCQSFNLDVLEQYLCLFAPSIQLVCGVSAYCMNIEECMNDEAEIDGKPWYHDINAYIKDGEYTPRATDNDWKFVRCMACQFSLSGEVLYKRNHDITLLQCIDAPKANHLVEEMHEGLLGAQANRPLLAQKIMRVGYYWLTIESDYIKCWKNRCLYYIQNIRSKKLTDLLRLQ